MATYTELFGLYSNSDLRNRVSVACIVAAETIRAEDPGIVNHANRLLWAKQVFEQPGAAAEAMLMAVLAANKALTASQIVNATDAAIQTAVNNEVNVFATGG